MARAIGPGPRGARAKVARHGTIGAPSKLNSILLKQIVERILVGNSLEDSAESVGLNRATAYEWLAKGRQKAGGPDESDVTYVEYADAITKARAECKVRLVVILRNAAQGAMRKHHIPGQCALLMGAINPDGTMVKECRCPELPDQPNAFLAARMLESIDRARWLRLPQATGEEDGPFGGLADAESPAARILKDAERVRARLTAPIANGETKKNGG